MVSSLTGLSLCFLLATTHAIFGQEASLDMLGEGTDQGPGLGTENLDVEFRFDTLDLTGSKQATHLLRVCVEAGNELSSCNSFASSVRFERLEAVCAKNSWFCDKNSRYFDKSPISLTDKEIPVVNFSNESSFAKMKSVLSADGGMSNYYTKSSYKGILQEGITIPTRVFSGPTQYEPGGYSGYSVLVFGSVPNPTDDRAYDICRSFMTSFVSSTATRFPMDQQFVTVWPVKDDKTAIFLNFGYDETICADAIREYDYEYSAGVVAAARKAGYSPSGRGPWILSWVPPETMGSSESYVLRMNLSPVDNLEEGQKYFRYWAIEIEEHPDTLFGYSVERVRSRIKRLSEEFGEDVFTVFSTILD